MELKPVNFVYVSVLSASGEIAHGDIFLLINLVLNFYNKQLNFTQQNRIVLRKICIGVSG